MKTPKLLLLQTAILFAISQGQTTDVERAGVVITSTLAGHADFLPGVPARGVTVELCTSNWQSVIASTKTDENGYFSFENPKTNKVLYLRLSAPGVNTYKLRVRVKKSGAPELKIRLSVAT